ncbi:MAG: J domain-containing protein [Rhodocyclaceae bacterium]|nr:J domain-containing protein [Rhodocyclaceae bacterium]
MVKNGPNPEITAQEWFAALEQAPLNGARDEAPENPVAALAALVVRSLRADKRLLIVLPDDEWLPALSQQLDLAARPLCLLLPGADFAAGITVRATLSLLRSRLTRGGEETLASAWAGQARRMDEHTELWQACLNWINSSLYTAWPPGLEALFPVLVMPASQAATLRPAADWVVLLNTEHLPANLPLHGTARVLHLTGQAFASAGGALQVMDELVRLRLELDLLTREVGELELELATAQGEMAEFTHRYYEHVGSRMVELDAIQAKIALKRAQLAASDGANQAEAQAADARAQRSRQEHERFRAASSGEEKPFTPGIGLKKLYRQVAQKIHPDRARSESDRSWRTQLMTEANRAYREGNEAALQEVLTLWQEGPGKTADLAHVDGGAATSGLAMQVANMKRRLTQIQAELDRLFGSKLYELFVAARQAYRQGRDLLREMAQRLDADIAAARDKLAQMPAN